MDKDVNQPYHDYVSPGLAIITPDAAFPNMVAGDRQCCPWPYLRRNIDHLWYVDRRVPSMGFLTRDEAILLHNLAISFRGKAALEIGCWLGWSTCHIALAGAHVDVVDPILARLDIYETVAGACLMAGVMDRVELWPGKSPSAVSNLATKFNRRWSFLFVDGDHEGMAPILDCQVCAANAEPDAMIVLHDLASPEVAQGLKYLHTLGWQVMIYQTMQIMGVAWRGNVKPIRHIPDLRVHWELPQHLEGFSVSS